MGGRPNKVLAAGQQRPDPRGRARKASAKRWLMRRRFMGRESKLEAFLFHFPSPNHDACQAYGAPGCTGPAATAVFGTDTVASRTDA